MRINFTLGFLIISNFLFSQPGTADNTFGFNGKVITKFNEYVSANAVAIAPGGKIVVAGYTQSSSDFVLAKYNSNGTPDPSFGINGKVITPVGATTNDVARAIAIQPDGKILVAGSSSGDFAIVRYTANGKPDNTFGNAGKVVKKIGDNDYLNAMVLLSDGSIIAGGSSNIGTTYYNYVLAKFTSNGKPDSTFGNNGIVVTDFGDGTDAGINALAIQEDGKIVAAGYTVYDFGILYDISLARYNANGKPDLSFGDNGKLIAPLQSQTSAASMAVQKDGKIVVGGFMRADNKDFLLVRFTNNGKLDNAFGTDGFVRGAYFDNIDESIKSIAIQTDGKIITAGTFSAGKSGIVVTRFGTDGKRDRSFGDKGLFVRAHNYVREWDNVAAVLQADEKIVVASTIDNGFGLIRLLGDEQNSTNPVAGIDSNKILRGVKFYPNPVINQLHIEKQEGGSALLNISDIAGNIIMQQTITKERSITDVSRLKPGNYIATILQSDKKISFAFIK